MWKLTERVEREGGAVDVRIEGGKRSGHRDNHPVAIDPAALWRVPLPAADQGVLERAFADDPELWVRLGVSFGGLVALGVEGVFVRAFARELHAASPSTGPALLVLAAASATLQELSCPR